MTTLRVAVVRNRTKGVTDAQVLFHGEKLSLLPDDELISELDIDLSDDGLRDPPFVESVQALVGMDPSMNGTIRTLLERVATTMYLAQPKPMARAA